MMSKHFFPFFVLPFSSTNSVFWGTEVFKFDIVPFVYFGVCYLCFRYSTKKLWPNAVSWSCFSLFSSRIFIGLNLTFRSLTHFNFCIWCKIRSHLHSFACEYPIFPASFIEKTVLSPWHFCWRSFDHIHNNLRTLNSVALAYMFVLKSGSVRPTLFFFKNVFGYLGVPWDSIWMLGWIFLFL